MGNTMIHRVSIAIATLGTQRRDQAPGRACMSRRQSAIQNTLTLRCIARWMSEEGLKNTRRSSLISRSAVATQRLGVKLFVAPIAGLGGRWLSAMFHQAIGAASRPSQIAGHAGGM